MAENLQKISYFVVKFYIEMAILSHTHEAMLTDTTMYILSMYFYLDSAVSFVLFAR